METIWLMEAAYDIIVLKAPYGGVLHMLQHTNLHKSLRQGNTTHRSDCEGTDANGEEPLSNESGHLSHKSALGEDDLERCQRRGLTNFCTSH